MNLKITANVLFIISLLFTIQDTALAKEVSYATADELGLMKGFPVPKEKLVTKATALQTPPYNRYSYLHMRNFYPTAMVKSAAEASTLIRKNDDSLSALSIPVPDSNETVGMDVYLERTYTDAFIVIKDGAIIYEKYLNGMTENQPHQMMSVTKSFAGLLGLMTVEDGLLSEDVVVSKYVPELKNSTAFGDATFRQVLNMTCSFEFSEDEADPNSDFAEWAAVLGVSEKQEGKEYADNMYEYLMKTSKTPGLEHGSEFHYQTPKADVVNWVVNKVTGKPFHEYLTEKIWSKIGTDGETYVLLDMAATLIAGGGLNATPNNLSRFAVMMLNDGKNADGEQVVSASIIDAIAKGGNIEAFSNGPASAGPMGNKDWSYRAQWWVRHTPGKEAFSAIGIHGQWVYINKNNGIAIIRQSSQPVSASPFFDSYNLNAFDTIISHLTKK